MWKTAKKLWVLYAKARGRQFLLEEFNATQRSLACFDCLLPLVPAFPVASHLTYHLAGSLEISHIISSYQSHMSCHVTSSSHAGSAQVGSLIILTPHVCKGGGTIPKIPGTYSVSWTHLTLVPWGRASHQGARWCPSNYPWMPRCRPASDALLPSFLC